MRFLFLYSVLCLSLAHARGQTTIDFAGENFFQMRASLEFYYDSLASAGDSSAYHEGGPYSRFRRWSEFWSLRLKEGTNFADYYNAQYYSQAAMLGRSAGNTDPWHEIGPKDKPSLGATSIGQGSQPGIGPIHFISFSDADANKMLCGSEIGGLWYTDNQGQGDLAWSNGGSDGGVWKRTGCKHAVFKVGDASTWYAANSGYFFYSGAILRGTNYGADWEVVADQSDFTDGSVWTRVNKIATDPSDPDVLYVATGHRLWRTNNVNALNNTDVIWSEVPIPIPASISAHVEYGAGNGYYYHDGRRVYDFEVDPDNSDNLYATVCFEGEVSPTQKVEFWRLMKSHDRGSTWIEMPNQPVHPFVGISGVMRNANLMTIEMAVSQPERLFVFYDLNDPNPPTSGAPNYSVDEIHKITNVLLGEWDIPLRTNIRMTYGAGNAFGVDQINGEDVYVDHNSSLGRYATYINGAWTNYSSSGNYLQYHVDVEDFVGDPQEEGVVWMANHGGIHRSEDFGATWEWRGSGLAVAEVYRMANSYKEPDRILTGLFHDANVLTEGAYGPVWEPEWRQLGGGDGQQPFIEKDEENWIYWSSQGSSWRKSGNYGSSPQTMSAWVCAALEWETAGAMDYGTPTAIYLPGWPSQSPNPCSAATGPAEIKRSINRGVSWEIISDFASLLNSGRKGIWRVYSSPYDPDDLVVHFSYGQTVFRTRMARGAAAATQSSWREIHVPRRDRFIADIDFDPNNSDVLYFAYSSEAMEDPVDEGRGMLFKVIYDDPLNPMTAFAEDLSAPVSIANALPNTGVGSGAVVLERGSNGGIYIGTDLGVFYTNNELLANGSGWQLLGANLPHVSCRGLEINYMVNKLRAGLEGRGVWEHDLWCPNDENRVESGTHGSSAFQEAINTVTSTAIVPAGSDVTYRGGRQVQLLPGFHAVDGSAFHAFIHPCDRAGNSFKSKPSGDDPSVHERETANAIQHNLLTVQPNPTQGNFTVSFQSGALVTRAVRLLNAQGRSIQISWRKTTSTLEVSLDTYTPAGIYLLQVFLSDGSLHHAKIIVEP